MKRRPNLQGRQGGAAAFEFAIAAIAFFIAMFMMIEVLRAVYVWNMLATVTRQVARAAIVAPPTPDALVSVRRNAILADTNDKSTAFGADVTADTIQVKYFNLQLNAVSSLPATGNANAQACHANPASASCVRFVQVQICEAGSDCTPLQFQPAFPLLPKIDLPTFLTLLPAQSLGCTGDCS